MASDKADAYWAKGGWQQQNYRNEPGVPITAKGRSGEALLASDTAEAIINATGEEPEVYSPVASSFTGHHPGPRCTAAKWFPESHVLRVTFFSGVSYNYFNVSEDDWRSFQSAPSAGRWINAHAFSYGQA